MMMRTFIPYFGALLFSLWSWPANSSVAIRLTFEELTIRSDRIVMVRLKNAHSFWDSQQRRIYTQFNFIVTEDVAGSGTKEISITQPGGTVDQWSQKSGGYPSFQTEQEVMLFLRKRKPDYQVVGMSQGVFGIAKKGKQIVLHQRLEGLSFVNDDEAGPFLMDKQTAFFRIHKLWQRKNESK